MYESYTIIRKFTSKDMYILKPTSASCGRGIKVIGKKEEIDSCAGLSHEFPTCEYALLSLAGDVDGYCGLDY